MTQSTLHTLPASLYTVIVTLSWGDPVVTKRYVRWDSDITIGSDVFESLPTMSVELPKKDGAISDNPGKLTLPSSADPMPRLASTFVHPRVKVSIDQIDPSSPTTTRKNLFYGDIGLVTKNPNGKPGLVKCSIAGIKSSLLELKLSISATTTCQNGFGDIRCGADSSSWDQTGTVDSLYSPERNCITLDLPSVSDPSTELPDPRFRGGYIDIGGLKMTIKKSRADKTFELFKVPPPWIVGEDCTVYAGCDKRKETCELWGRISRFVAPGIKTPPRNPVYEGAE